MFGRSDRCIARVGLKAQGEDAQCQVIIDDLSNCLLHHDSTVLAKDFIDSSIGST
jgi:hypothetical protein